MYRVVRLNSVTFCVHLCSSVSLPVCVSAGGYSTTDKLYELLLAFLWPDTPGVWRSCCSSSVCISAAAAAAAASPSLCFSLHAAKNTPWRPSVLRFCTSCCWSPPQVVKETPLCSNSPSHTVSRIPQCTRAGANNQGHKDSSYAAADDDDNGGDDDAVDNNDDDHGDTGDGGINNSNASDLCCASQDTQTSLHTKPSFTHPAVAHC